MSFDPVTDALARIAARRGDSFAVVVDPTRENLFAQFVAHDDEAGLYGELPGNDVLPKDERLTEGQQWALKAQGWAGDGDENWHRTWPDASTEAALQQIALDALTALRDLYGARGDVQVQVELM